MASPVVAGTAALLLSYFPYLTPEQLKECIEKGSSHLQDNVQKPGSSEKVPVSELCKSGGFLNAFEAVKIASTLAPTINKSNKNGPVLKQKKD
jgi:hypothetical protein